jgi:transposase
MRVRRSKLTDEQTRRLLEHFVAGTPARTAAELVRVNRNTARLFYHKMRELIVRHLEHDDPSERSGEVGEAHVAEASHTESAALQAETTPDSIVRTDPSGDDRPLDGYVSQQQRVPRRARASQGPANLSGSENFRNQAKRHLRRYNGVPPQHLHLFMKECEWRFNYGPPKQLLRLLKSWIKTDSRKPPSMPDR